MLRLKPGVSLRNLQPQTVLGLMLVEQVYGSLGAECVLTSGNDGTHKAGSLHPEGRAVDLRTKNLHPDDKPKLLARLSDLLGSEWDVLLEAVGTDNEHLHVEWDPG